MTVAPKMTMTIATGRPATMSAADQTGSSMMLGIHVSEPSSPPRAAGESFVTAGQPTPG
jgi:hypothetical protein